MLYIIWFIIGLIAVVYIIINFNKKEKKQEELYNIEDFKIEYYPYSTIYVAKYKDSYLKEQFPTRIIVLTENILFAEKFKNEEDARNFINKYIEQQFKLNVQIIPFKKAENTMTYMEAILNNKALLTDIDDYVERWHNNEAPKKYVELRDYLGMTKEDYALWVMHPNKLIDIIEKYKSIKS